MWIITLMAKKIKTLLVEYAPREKASRTRQLRNHFTELIRPHTVLKKINLNRTVPDLLTPKMVRAYYKRNYAGKTLTKAEQKLWTRNDKFRDQLLKTDVLILSTPLYNFGLPAVVKAWIDAVMQRGYVYEIDERGHVPKLRHLQVCIVYTAGIMYDQINENEHWNGLNAETARLFEYMGAKEVRVVHIEGIDMLPQTNIDYRRHYVAHAKFNRLARDWYGVEHNLKIYE